MITIMVSGDPKTAHLRILATSDLHMHLLSYDYYQAEMTEAGSLSGLVEPISELRRAAAAETPERHCLLMDNGDLLQGNPLGDHIAAHHTHGTTHPLASAMNTLGYDAVGLGNHDLDFGLPYVAAYARDLNAPVISSNLRLHTPSPWFVPHAVIPAGDIWVGVVSVLPPATMKWTPQDVSNQIEVAPMVAAVRRTALETRIFGADLVIALAHTGFGVDEDENGLSLIAEDGAVDVLLAGHSHQEFPVPDFADYSGANIKQGTLHGIPTIMPGFGGAYLGCIDLDLSRDGNGDWQVESHACELVPARPRATAIAPPLLSLRPSHDAAILALDKVVGTSDAPLHSFFAQAAPSNMLRVMALAQRKAVDAARRGSDVADLPLVSVVSAMRAGGLGGPDGYADIPTGPLFLRHLSQMLPFANALVGVVVTGAELREWLEKSAICFNQVLFQDAPQFLLNPQVAAIDFDVAFGCQYDIDVSVPPRYDTSGTLVAPNHHRIHNLRIDGTELAPDARVLVAVNSYRASGGSKFPGLGTAAPSVFADGGCFGALNSYLSDPPDVPAGFDSPWSFSSKCNGLVCRLRTGPSAEQHLDEIAHLSPGTPIRDEDGFLNFPITL